MKEPIILIGGGGHCISCIDVIETHEKYAIAGIIDVKENIGKKVMGYDVIGADEDLAKLSKTYQNYLITLGQIRNPQRRMEIYGFLEKLQVNMPAIFSPYARVSRHAKVGRGTIIMHHALLNAGSVVGNNCIINSKALVEHDAVIGDHCHISTACVVNGGVKVGKGSFVGSGAVCREYVSIPEFSFIKANSIYKG
jgi:sugar O-acyltransferase (sialic acid O-acetyltransferase NeuD family)